MVYSYCRGAALRSRDELDQLYMEIRNGKTNKEDTVANGTVETRQECCSK